MNQEHRSCYVFGEFRLDEAERQLRLNGTPVPLSPKIFDTLLLLVQNAGHLVEKDEFMRQLWPGTFVGEDALARNISILRKTLGESSDSQSVITTVPTRGYRFTASVQRVSAVQAPEAQADLVKPISRKPSAMLAELPVPRSEDRPVPALPAASPASHAGFSRGQTGKQSFLSRRITLLVLGLVVGSVAGVITFYLLLPGSLPRVVRTDQITHSGRVDAWARISTDGSRIYYIERQGDHWDLMESSVSGGDSHKIQAPFRNTVVMDVSPDRLQLLIGSFEHRGTSMPLWIWPVQGGALKRVGQIETSWAVWMRDGRQIVYAENNGIYITDPDGTNSRKFVQTDGMPGGFSWSPDGQVLRFNLESPRAGVPPALWEVRADGTHLHPLLPGWSSLGVNGVGSWSPDGRYFVFHSYPPSELWILREHAAFFRTHHDKPMHLVTGPMIFWNPVFDRSGRKLFVIGINGGGELVRYDVALHRATPLLPGVCSQFAIFSPDGTQLACPSPSERGLVRMRPDGSDRLVLTPASIVQNGFTWSPDGKQIVFDGVTEKSIERLYLVSTSGGASRALFPDTQNQFDPAWSPDGKLLAFARTLDSPASAEPQSNIQVLDLSTNQMSLLTGSLGIRSPAWSPDGHSIAGVTVDGHKLMLFDLRTQQWTELCEGNLIFSLPRWLKDNESIYFQDILAEGESVYRFRLSTHKKELLASFQDLLNSGVQRVAFHGFTPDGALITAVDRNVADVYSVELDLP